MREQKTGLEESGFCFFYKNIIGSKKELCYNDAKKVVAMTRLGQMIYDDGVEKGME